MLVREEARHIERIQRPLKPTQTRGTVRSDLLGGRMQSKSISRILMAAAAIAIGCGVLASTASATAQSENNPCSNRTIFGDYGFALEGVILGPGLQLRGIVLQHYDGRGNLTQVDHIVTEGMPPQQEWTPGSGTYTVNPDCT